MSITAESPIAILKESTRRVPRAPRAAHVALVPLVPLVPQVPQVPLVLVAKLALARLCDGVDTFADRMVTLVFTTGTAQTFE